MSFDYTNPEHEAVLQGGCRCSRCKKEREKRALGKPSTKPASVPFSMYERLSDAAGDLYRAGHWHCPNVHPDQAALLWERLRDALGLLPNGPNKNTMTNTPRTPPTYAATPRAPGAPDMCDRREGSGVSAEWRLKMGIDGGLADFAAELRKAREKHGPMASAHEGYAIILEELDELKAHVWQKQKTRDYAEMRKEVVQLGAMALAFLVEIVDTENRK